MMRERVSKKDMGRLALREEGKYWNAYFALPNTMEGAIWIGSIPLVVVMASKRRKEQFMALMMDVVSDLLEAKFGERPIWPDPPHPAPESERSRS